MYHMNWVQENKVLLLELSGNLEIEELKAMNQDLIANFLSKVDKKICMIILTDGIESYPRQTSQLAAMAHEFGVHTKLDICVYVGKFNPVLTFAVTIVSRIMGQNFKMVETVDKAQSLLENMGKLSKNAECG